MRGIICQIAMAASPPRLMRSPGFVIVPAVRRVPSDNILPYINFRGLPEAPTDLLGRSERSQTARCVRGLDALLVAAAAKSASPLL
jgi:hypothetical protein